MARQAASDTITIGRDILQDAIAKVEKDFGKGTIINSSLKQEKVDVISTGSIGLDIATGIGGIPRGKVTEIIGWEQAGKTTITWQTIGNAQKQELGCLYVDGEQSFDAKYARSLGIDTDKLYIQQLGMGGGEECYNVSERLIRTGKIGLVVYDSQTSLIPKKQMEGEVGDSMMSIHARMMSQSVPKIMNAAAQNNCAVIYVSQFREKIGVMFGSPETTNGGHALKFYAHMRIEVRKTLLKEEDEIVANKTKCKVIKNKLADPYGTAEFRITFGKGVDRSREVLDMATENDIIKKAGSWYSFNNDNIGQGEEAVLQLFNDNPDFYLTVYNSLMEKLKS